MLSAVAMAIHYLRPPTQNVRFLAKRLLDGELSGYQQFTDMPVSRVILATPIYVHTLEPVAEENRWGLDKGWDVKASNP